MPHSLQVHQLVTHWRSSPVYGQLDRCLSYSSWVKSLRYLDLFLFQPLTSIYGKERCGSEVSWSDDSDQMIRQRYLAAIGLPTVHPHIEGMIEVV